MFTGIITEYNPFHKGHKYHLDNAIADTNAAGIVCVMSGNFMQRGIPAIVDKWKRAEMAIKNGVDLVLELPLVYSISSAESFAFGAVSLLNALGIIDFIYFGSEEGNIELLEEIADALVLEPSQYKLSLKKYLDIGLPFHLSREKALSDYFNLENSISSILSNSNNILAIEYIKTLKKLKSNIIPKTLKREGSKYNDYNLTSSFASATSIRNTLKSKSITNLKEYLTNSSYEVLLNLITNNYKFTFEEDMFKYIKYKLITNSNCLSNLPDVSEGLDNRILKEILKSDSLDNLILNSKSKRYTYSRVNRILAQSFLNLENYELLKLQHSIPNYARVLGFNSNGRNILKEIKAKKKINIITKIQKNNLTPSMELDILGTKAYSILNPAVNPMDDYLKSPIII